MSLPQNVVAASGFDVLSHAIESYTARAYHTRSPAFTKEGRRPMLQGKNPYADIGCREALRICGKFFLRAVSDPSDVEARVQMSFAASIAGAAMGNAGTQLPHGLSYGVSGSVRSHRVEGYPSDHPIIPHGMSVILNAPSVARFSNKYCGDLQLEVLDLLGRSKAAHGPAAEAGEHLAQYLIELMKATGTPNGLGAVGFTSQDIPMLVEKAFPQKRVIDNAPFVVSKEVIAELYEGGMQYW
jgi:alcohol dehydrogenase class IV